MNEHMETNQIMVIEGLKIERVTDSMNKIASFQQVIQNTLKEGIDYGAAFHGSKKPNLLKPGAEKILMLLGLSSEYEIIEKIQDYEDGFFAYTIKCTLLRGDTAITEGLGHCNSKERKYDSDKQDKYMLGNTCLKMAKKRAQVDAALTVGSLSNVFTQDIEDMVQFDAEEIKTMTAAEAKGVKVGFGKHKGKTVGEIFETAPDYVEWLAGKSNDPTIKKAAEMMISASPQPQAPPKVDQETGEVLEGNQEELPWE